jgi:hypothetical protein
LIPVIMLLEKSNLEDEAFCRRLATEVIVWPTQTNEWIEAGKKICAACA